MPKKKEKNPNKPTVLKLRQLKQRLTAHENSEVWVVARGPFGDPIPVRILGIRIVMQDYGKPDQVEILV